MYVLSVFVISLGNFFFFFPALKRKWEVLLSLWYTLVSSTEELNNMNSAFLIVYFSVLKDTWIQSD